MDNLSLLNIPDHDLRIELYIHAIGKKYGKPHMLPSLPPLAFNEQGIFKYKCSPEEALSFKKFVERYGYVSYSLEAGENPAPKLAYVEQVQDEYTKKSLAKKLKRDADAEEYQQYKQLKEFQKQQEAKELKEAFEKAVIEKAKPKTKAKKKTKAKPKEDVVETAEVET